MGFTVLVYYHTFGARVYTVPYILYCRYLYASIGTDAIGPLIRAYDTVQ